MRKNVMLSLLAATTASLGVYAKANVSSIIVNTDKTSWRGTKEFSWANNVITSPGVMVSQDIQLYPGKYTLSATLTGISGKDQLSVAKGNTILGTATNGSVTFEVTGISVQTITISVESTDGSQFTATDFKLSLIYSFADAKKNLNFDLSEVINTIKTGAVGGKNLSDRASAIGAEISAIPDDSQTDATKDAYDKYYAADGYKLYLGYANSPIETEISTLKDDVAKANGNTTAYDNARAGIKIMNDSLGIATTKLNAYAYSYKKATIFTPSYNVIEKIVKDFTAEVEIANTNSTAATVCTDDVIKAKKHDVHVAVDKLVAVIDSAITNTIAYDAVAKSIAFARTLYSDTLQSMITLLPGAPDVYANMLAEAQGKLKKDLVLITNAEIANGSADAHDSADANQKTNENNLKTATDDIKVVGLFYYKLAAALKADYAAAVADTAALTKSLNDININGQDGKLQNATLNEGYKTIKDLIHAFGANIIAANKNYSISDYKAGTSYANEKQTIVDKIKSFSKTASPIVANYNAEVNCLADIDKNLTKVLAADKTEIDKLVSTNKDYPYTVSNFYLATYKKLTDAIQIHKDSITNASSAVAYYKKYNGTDHTTITSSQAATVDSIASYLTNAKLSWSTYVTDTTAITEYNAKYAALVEATKANTAVTVGGDPLSSDTYQSELDSYSKKIKTITDALTVALGKKDDEHLAALSKVTLDATITSGINNLISSYKRDKSTYDGKVQTAAAKTMVTQAKARVSDMIAGYDGTDISTLGGSLATYIKYCVKDSIGNDVKSITDTLTAIAKSVYGEEAKISAAEGKIDSDAAGAIAILNVVNSDISSITSRISAMSGRITTAKKAVTDNKRTYDTAVAQIKAVFYKIYGNGNATPKIPSLFAYYGDPDKGPTFNADIIKPLQSTLNADSTEIETAYKNYSLVAAWADTKNAQGAVTTQGLETLMSELSMAVDSARITAEKATANYNEKIDQQNAYDDAAIATLLGASSSTDEKTAYGQINNHAGEKATDPILKDAVKKHYTDLAKGYSDQNDHIQSTISTNYNFVHSVDYKTVYDSITSLKAAVKDIITGVAKNDSTYALQIASLKKAQSYWTLVYDSISVRDQSYASKDVLASLAVQQTAITTLGKTINGYYTNGQLVAKDEEVTKAIGTINTEIAKISTDQKNSYYANILSDNKIRYDRFLTAIGKADSTYTTAITEITKFNSIKNTDLRAKIQTVIDANQSIYVYSSKIIDKKSTVENEFTTLQKEGGKVIFDIDEKYTADATEFQDSIETALKKFTDLVDVQAHKVFDVKMKYANDTLVTAQKLIGNYGETVKSNAFSELKALIIKANAAATDHSEFAINLDKFIDQFKSVNVDNLVANGYIAAANAERSFLFDPIATKFGSDTLLIANYTYNKSSYVSDLKDNYKTYITNGALKIANDAAEKLYVKETFDAVISDTLLYYNAAYDPESGILSSAKKYNQNNVDNQNAYQRMLGYISAAQDSLDKAQAYVSSYYYVANTLDDYISADQFTLNRYSSDVLEYKNQTTAVSKENDIKSSCDAFVKYTVPAIVLLANTDEISGLTSAIGILKKEYNIAAVKFGIDNATVKTFNSDITGYESDLSVINKKADKTTAAQNGLLALETKIAKERTSIVNYYDTTIVSAAVKSISDSIVILNKAYDTESSYLGTCDQTRVKDIYSKSLNAIGVSIADVKNKFNSYNAATPNTVLFYSDNLKVDIDKLTSELRTLSSTIKGVQDPIDTNLGAYNRIIGVLDGYNTTLNTLTSTINAYESTIKKSISYKTSIDSIAKTIMDAKEVATTFYNNGFGSLNASSLVPKESDITNAISVLALTAANNEAAYQIDTLKSTLGLSYTLYGKSKYSPTDITTLSSLYDNISTSIGHLSDYRTDAVDGSISKDIDGTTLDKAQTIDFVTTAFPAIITKIADLKSSVETYANGVANDSYVLGDVVRDGKVYVNDYSVMLKFAGDPSQVDAKSATFYAADVNQDGKINIGDVTAVANMISNPTSGALKAKAMAYIAPVTATNDAISLSAEGEGSTKRITINLANTTAFVAGQMDIKLPAGMTLLGESLSNRANGHSIYSTDLNDGTHRVIISTVENNEFNNSESAILYLDVNVTNKKASDNISVSNIMFTDASARIYNLADIVSDETTGINSISSEQGLGSKIYSVSGKLMNGLRKGVNIIRNNNGSTQKIIKR